MGRTRGSPASPAPVGQPSVAVGIPDWRAGRDAGVPPTFVVAGAKGGVGKSVIAILLARSLAEYGQRALLVDGEQNLGMLHVLLNVRLQTQLDAVVREEVDPEDLLVRVASRLWLLPSALGTEELYGLGVLDRARLHFKLTRAFAAFDVVIVDVGSELESVVRVASLGATRLILVTTAEPGALAGARALVGIVHLQVPALPIDVLVNRTDTPREAESTFAALRDRVGRGLTPSLHFLGGMPTDPDLRHAVWSGDGLTERIGECEAVRTARAVVSQSLLPAALSHESEG